VSAVNDRHVTIKALEMALKRRCPEIGLLHHSDQGCTYASEDYEAILDARGIVCSMSRPGNGYDNAVMESFFSTVKSELADRFDTYGNAKMELFDYTVPESIGDLDIARCAGQPLAGVANPSPTIPTGGGEPHSIGGLDRKISWDYSEISQGRATNPRHLDILRYLRGYSHQ
jgi:transposase InsO family protein